MVGIARNECQISPGRLVRFGAALFPVTQRADWNMIAGGKFLLRQFQCTPYDFRLRCPPHPLEIASRKRLGIGIRAGRPIDRFGGHWPG